MNAIRWLVLDNLKHGWPYRTNICDWEAADAAYRWAVNNEFVRDGKITPEGESALLILNVSRNAKVGK